MCFANWGLRMNKQLMKVQRKVQHSVRIGREFGIEYGLSDAINSCILREKGPLGRVYQLQHYKMIKKYLKTMISEVNYVLEKNTNEIENVDPKSKIWIFWWQGMQTAPAMVKTCVASVYKYAGSHEIVLLSKDNVDTYADIPNWIYQKVEMGFISLTHFADILRAQLLYQHGGIWMDATILMTGNFSEDIYRNTFYTINHGQYADFHVCKGKWATNFLACGKNNPLFDYIRKAHYTYWQNTDVAICYLLIDCFIANAYENTDWVRQMVDDVPTNNTGTFYLSKCIMRTDVDNVLARIPQDTYLHKMTYKINDDVVKESQKTLLKYLVNIVYRNAKKNFDLPWEK